MCWACKELRQQMILKDKTAGQLAREIGRSQGYVSQILCAHTLPDLSDVIGIAAALDIPPAAWARYFAPPEMAELAAQRIKGRRKK